MKRHPEIVKGYSKRTTQNSKVNGLDIVFSIILIIGLIGGFQKGFVKSISGFIGIGLAIWIGFNFSNLLEAFVIEQEFIPAALVKIVSLILTIVLVILAIKILSKILHTVVHTVGLGIFNRLGGAIFGFLIHLLALSAIIYHTYPFISKIGAPELWEQSRLTPHLLEIAELLKVNFF